MYAKVVSLGVTVVNFLFKPYFQEDTNMVGRFIYAYLTCKLILLGKKRIL